MTANLRDPTLEPEAPPESKTGPAGTTFDTEADARALVEIAKNLRKPWARDVQKWSTDRYIAAAARAGALDLERRHAERERQEAKKDAKKLAERARKRAEQEAEQERKRAEKKAKRTEQGQRMKAARAGWKDELRWIQTGRGPMLEKVLLNAIVILRNDERWRGRLAFDTFAQCLSVRAVSPVTSKREKHPVLWEDQHSTLTTAWLQKHYQLDLTGSVVYEAVGVVARETSIHPLKSRVLSNKWDDTVRLDTWLTVYLGVADTPYVRDVGAKWLISAIARLFDPGCQVDHVLVLEGPQGKNKSSALRLLSYGYFTDEMPDLRSKDAHIQVLGVWIVEFAELDAALRTEPSRVKAFITAREPRFRSPYGRIAVTTKRACVFAGTVNGPDWQRDESGGRRWWPVEVGTIDLEALKRDLDQLWAEARVRYLEKKPWWFTDVASTERAEAEQDDRYQGDEWDGSISLYIDGKEYVTVGDILTTCLGLAKKEWKQPEQNRVSELSPHRARPPPRRSTEPTHD